MVLENAIQTQFSIFSHCFDCMDYVHYLNSCNWNVNFKPNSSQLTHQTSFRIRPDWGMMHWLLSFYFLIFPQYHLFFLCFRMFTFFLLLHFFFFPLAKEMAEVDVFLWVIGIDLPAVNKYLLSAVQKLVSLYQV